MYWLKLDPEDEQRYQRRRAALGEAKDHFLHDMSILDTKSSALLTHVSIMIAVVALFLQDRELPTFLQVTLTVELTLFSLVAVTLFWCVDIMGPPLRQLPSDDGNEIALIYRAEILSRRANDQIALHVVRALTLILIVTVLVKSAV